MERERRNNFHSETVKRKKEMLTGSNNYLTTKTLGRHEKKRYTQPHEGNPLLTMLDEIGLMMKKETVF